MIKKSVTLLILVVMLLTAFGIDYTPANAYAYDTTFVSKIHYQNIGTETASLSITFYDQNGVEVASLPVTTLEPDAATSLYAGTIGGLTSGFKGSAVISSNQPLASVVAQVGSGAVKNQPLSSGFSQGSSSVLIPTVLKQMFFFTSVFAVQNVDSVAADFKLTFVPVTGSQIIYNVTNVPANASRLFDMGTVPAITESTFNGAVLIESFKNGTTTPGLIVGTSMELENAGYNAYAFDGASATANKIYMPTAVCKFGPNKNSTSAYAVQNNNNVPVNVTVTYSNGNVDGPYSVPAYGKRSFDGCQAGNAVGYLGSAIVTSTGGNIHVVGKVYGGGLYPAHLAFINGSSNVALPFIRWTEANWLNGVGQRTYIAIQNIGTSNIPAGAVSVKYYDKNGALIGTHTLGAIAVGAKGNSHPYYLGPIAAEFGTYTDGSEGGGAVVEGPVGSQLAVVVRVQKYLGAGNSAGDDYTGIPIN
jgi:hypothetical protein